MAFIDMPLEELEAYRPARVEPADFATFWQETLAEARRHPLGATYVPANAGLKTLDVYDVSFAGYAGQPIRGWFLVPAGAQAPLPCIVQYIGYGGGRAFPINWIDWPSLGYAHFVMDTRGQGSGWSRGIRPIPSRPNPTRTIPAS